MRSGVLLLAPRLLPAAPVAIIDCCRRRRCSCSRKAWAVVASCEMHDAYSTCGQAGGRAGVVGGEKELLRVGASLSHR